MSHLWQRIGWRRAIGAVALLACGAVLYRRIHTLVSEPRIPVAARVAQLMYNRLVALEVIAYAEKYRRPPYEFDSVLVHLDSAGRQRVRDLRVDLWGREVRYWWSWCDFSVMSDAGDQWDRVPAAQRDTMWQQARARGRMMTPTAVYEQFAWPKGVGRNYRCGAGP